MARRILWHIGLPKTGTTFVQSTMWHNRELARERGVLYPGTSRFQHYNALHEVRGAPPGKVPADGVWSSFVAEAAAFDGDVLISHEFFSVLNAARIRAAARAWGSARIEVVVTARSYVRQFPAVWQEALKMHDQRGFDEFMQAALRDDLTGAWGWATQDLAKVLARWSSVVPPAQITVVTVPPPGAPRDLLWRRWCEAIGLDDTGFDLDVHYANESIGAAQAALLRRVKPHLSGDLTRGPVKHRWVRQYFGHEVLVPQRGERFTPRPDQRDALLARVEPAITAVETGGYRVVGDLDDLRDPGPETSAHPDDVTAEEVLEVAARAIEQMIRDMKAMTEERDTWRRRAQRRGRGAGLVTGRATGRARGAWAQLRRRATQRGAS